MCKPAPEARTRNRVPIALDALMLHSALGFVDLPHGERTYRGVSTLEHVELLLGAGEGIGWDYALEDLNGNVPELLVLALDEEDNAGALGVEGGRNVEESLLDDLLNAGIRDWRLLLKRVVSTALGDGLEECSGRHVCCSLGV